MLVLSGEWEHQSATSLCFLVFFFFVVVVLCLLAYFLLLLYFSFLLPHSFALKMTHSPQPAEIQLWTLVQKLQAYFSH